MRHLTRGQIVTDSALNIRENHHGEKGVDDHPAYYHDHEKDPRATLRAKDPEGLHVFGKILNSIGSANEEDMPAVEDPASTQNLSGLLNLFHLIHHRVIFPFTPTITIGGRATYDDYSFTHTNYKYHAYDKSAPDDIQIVADFVAQTPKEAEYLLGVMHFFRTLTKSYFGNPREGSLRPGTPPPVLFFNYMGKYQFNDVPVVISDYSYLLEPDIDYVEVHGRDTRVPSEIHMTINLKHFYNPKRLRDEFDLETFRTGSLITKGYV